MATSMVLDSIEHAICTRTQPGVLNLKDVVHHRGRGSQYISLKFTERLAEAGTPVAVDPPECIGRDRHRAIRGADDPPLRACPDEHILHAIVVDHAIRRCAYGVKVDLSAALVALGNRRRAQG